MTAKSMKTCAHCHLFRDADEIGTCGSCQRNLCRDCAEAGDVPCPKQTRREVVETPSSIVAHEVPVEDADESFPEVTEEQFELSDRLERIMSATQRIRSRVALVQQDVEDGELDAWQGLTDEGLDETLQELAAIEARFGIQDDSPTVGPSRSTRSRPRGSAP